ncbi:hypothetical protein ScPMuIL_004681 [Solemya velum]
MKISICLIVLTLAAMSVSVKKDSDFGFGKAINSLGCDAAYGLCIMMGKKRPQGMFPRIIQQCKAKYERCLKRVYKEYY